MIMFRITFKLGFLSWFWICGLPLGGSRVVTTKLDAAQVHVHRAEAWHENGGDAGPGGGAKVLFQSHTSSEKVSPCKPDKDWPISRGNGCCSGSFWWKGTGVPFLAPSVPPLQVSMQVSTRHIGHEKRRTRRFCWIYSNLTDQTHETIWVNYSISLIWMVRPSGDDFPH